MKIIEGGYQLSIRNGVLWLNTTEGSILRITGLPRSTALEVENEAGTVTIGYNGN